MLATSAKKLEEVLEERNELVLALAVGEEEREENGEVAGTHHDLLGDLLCQLASHPRVVRQVVEGTHTLE